jgi:phage-related protein
MASTSFTWVPDYGAQQTSRPRVKSIAFGDGYEQRLQYGLNTDLKVWNLKFDHVETSVKDQIVGFLEARGGVQQFNWAALDGSVKAYVCQEWDVTATYPTLWTITATFREVVDL